MVLVSVQSYIILTFFKTMFLVIVLGLLHGVVFLPIALIHLLPTCITNLHGTTKVSGDDSKPNSATITKVMLPPTLHVKQQPTLKPFNVMRTKVMPISAPQRFGSDTVYTNKLRPVRSV
jgi:hypothetical protein